MTELTTEDIRTLDWGDARLRGFLWEEGGTHLRLFLEHASRPVRSLLSHWVTDLRVPGRWLHPLLSWSARIEPTPAGRWLVSIDFASDGVLSLECEQITASVGDV